MADQTSNDSDSISSLKVTLSMVDRWIADLETEEQEILKRKSDYKTTRKTLVEEIEKQLQKSMNYRSDAISLPPPKSPVVFNKDYYNAKTIKDFSKEEFMSSIQIDIQPDEFKEGTIHSAAIAILRRLKEPLNKKQLAALIEEGGKEPESNDFPESVKNSLKKMTGQGQPFLTHEGWYFLREWNLSQWGLDENGDILVDAENNVEAGE